MGKIWSQLVVSILGIVAGSCAIFYGVAFAAGTMVIAGLQTGSSTNQSAEFVRLANISAQAIDLTGWRLQYKSSSGTSWVTKATLLGSIGSGQQLLVSSGNFQTAEVHQTMTDGLASAGGHVQLIDKNGASQDRIGWGTASQPEGQAAPAPIGDQTLTRIQDQNGTFTDSDNNLADFVIVSIQTSSPDPILPPAPSSTGNTGLVQPQITELLPNPAAPQTDTNDEYIELYNPNQSDFALSGYRLQTGSSFSYSLSFTDQVLPAGGFMIFTSGSTPLTLSNTSGAARLLDPGGNVVDQTSPYAAAAEGQAWAKINGSWQWTTTPTPGSRNVLAAPAGVAGSGSTKSTKTSTAKSKTTAVKAAKTSVAKSTGGTSAASKDNEQAKPSSSLHPIVLVAVGGLAVVYGAYEYRHDLGNILYKLRRYRSNRRSNRKAA